MATGLDGFAGEALGQTVFFERAQVVVYARVLRALVELLEQDDGVRAGMQGAWAEREFVASYERPLLVLAALHREALADPTYPLAPSLLGGGPLGTAELAVALTSPSSALETIRTRFVQTNEVTRAIAWRLAFPPSWQDEPAALVDLGCSAGLNLVADRLPLSWRTAEGAPIELVAPRRIVARFGLDRAPSDPSDPEAALWLRACLWPGQAERRARLDAAIEAAGRARAKGEMELVPLEAEAMPAWLEGLSGRQPQARVLAYHSIFAEYLLPEARARFDTAMHAWVQRHGGRAMWVQFETAPKGAPGPVRLTASIEISGSVKTLGIGTCEYHPRTMAVDDAALRQAWAGIAL